MSSPQPTASPDLRQQAYDHLRAGLNQSRWLPGDRISGNAVARELNISRTPVRDAMHQLASEGLLLLKAKSGAVVRDLRGADLRDCFVIRQALEPMAAARACRRITTSRLRQLRTACLRMKRLARQIVQADFADVELNRAMQLADAQFHQIIIEAADNPRLLRIIEDHRLLTRKVQYPSRMTVSHLACTLLEHWRIYRALLRRDAGAAGRAMRQHIRRGARMALQSDC